MHTPRPLAATLAALAAVAVALPLVPAAGAYHLDSPVSENGANQMRLPPLRWWYFNDPHVHDQIGRSNEPDFATLSELVVNPLQPEQHWTIRASNCVVAPALDDGCFQDWSLPPPPPGHSSTIAPGCTGDAGRQPSGLCGLWTIGAAGELERAVGVQGMSGSAAPGRFSQSKATQIAFFDLQFHTQAANLAVAETNRDLEDLGLKSAMAGIDRNTGGDTTAGGGTFWAWLGRWQDKNGNGVINELIDDQNRQRPDNEFTWYGSCAYGVPGDPGGPGNCFRKSLEVPVWAFPGTHTNWCGGYVGVAATCLLFPSDFWGQSLVCFVDGGLTDGALPTFCPRYNAADAANRQWSISEAGGYAQYDADNLMAPTELGDFFPDFFLTDSTVEPKANRRGWFAGAGFPYYFYDEGLVTHLSTYAAVINRDTGGVLFRDVDHYRSWSPAVENLLRHAVMPVTKQGWVFARETVEPARQCLDSLCGDAAVAPAWGRTVYDAESQVDTTPVDPGFSHEPNTQLDAYPGAVRRPCGDAQATHEGRCNDYAGYRAGRHAYVDAKAYKLVMPGVDWRVPGSALDGFAPMPTGPAYTSSWNAGPGREDPGSPRAGLRTFDPGAYVFRLNAGTWKDGPHRILENTAVAPGVGARWDYPVEADGWIGDLVQTTETWKRKGYDQDVCQIAPDAAPRPHPYGHCHPFLDGAISDPSDFEYIDPVTGAREFEGTCGARGTTGPLQVRVEPLAGNGLPGVWTVPVFVWRDFATWNVGDPAAVEDFTGRGALTLNVDCVDPWRGQLLTRDVLVLPAGNLGLTVRTRVDAVLVVAQGVAPERVVDVDEYVGILSGGAAQGAQGPLGPPATAGGLPAVALLGLALGRSRSAGRARLRPAWIALAAVIAVTPSGLGYHLDPGLADNGANQIRQPPLRWWYFNDPHVHDQIGRSQEPDHIFLRQTLCCGPVGPVTVDVANCVADPGLRDRCVADWDLPWPAPGHARVLAPGCTDDSGRQPAGLCGAFTVGAAGQLDHVFGAHGMSQSAAPGLLSDSKATQVAFFDVQFHSQAANLVVAETNRDAEDLGVEASLAGLNGNLGQDTAAASGTFWAWFGRWQDKNGNGVIDEMVDPETNAERADNEFTWYGRCSVTGPRNCIQKPNVWVPVWAWPGTHTNWCGGYVGAAAACLAMPSDYWGQAAVCFLDAGVMNGGLPTFCPPFTPADRQVPGWPGNEAAGQPGSDADNLLSSTQLSDLFPDFFLTDATIESDLTRRGWFAGAGFPFYFYDEGLLARLTTYAEVRDGFEGQTLFSDADVYGSWSPEVDNLLQGTVKPLTRATWIFAREELEPARQCLDSACGDPALGPLWGRGVHDAASQFDATLVDPGFSHEPNTASDAFPGAVRRACADAQATHEGRCNDYSGYRSALLAYADARAYQLVVPGVDWRIPTGALNGFAPLPTGPAYTSSWNAGPGRQDPGSPRAGVRTLDPGAYVFRLNVGRWVDQPHRVIENTNVADVVGQRQDYTLPADGWIGNIVQTTETWKRKGYDSDVCQIAPDASPQPHAYARCHPYMSGALSDPSDFDHVDAVNGRREFLGTCLAGGANGAPAVTVTPLGPNGAPGVWNVPVFVWRDYATWRVGDVASLQDWTGTQASISLAASCVDPWRGQWMTRDLLIFPLGNPGLDVQTRFHVRVLGAAGANAGEVIDVDTYEALLGGDPGPQGSQASPGVASILGSLPGLGLVAGPVLGFARRRRRVRAAEAFASPSPAVCLSPSALARRDELP